MARIIVALAAAEVASAAEGLAVTVQEANAGFARLEVSEHDITDSTWVWTAASD